MHWCQRSVCCSTPAVTECRFKAAIQGQRKHGLEGRVHGHGSDV